MAKAADDIPPIPIPPVEPPPVAAATVIPPLVDLTANGPVAPARPDPYAQSGANPYYQQPQPYAAPQPYRQPYQQGYQPYAYQPYQSGPPSGLAIASMALGLAGLFLTLFWLGFLPAVAAVITGHLAVKRQPHAKGFWLTGLITGYVGIGISLLGALAILLFFVLGLIS